MKITTEDAVAILQRLAEQQIVKAAFTPKNNIGGFAVHGKLGFLNEPEGNWVAVKDRDNFAFFQFTGCEFEYGDANEFPEQFRTSGKELYAGVLTLIHAESGERFYLFEFKL